MVKFIKSSAFSSVHSQKPLEGALALKPDIMLIRLIDRCTQNAKRGLWWPDVQVFFEHTREKKPPMWMPETVTLKSYQMFCTQPERDFVISLCITGEGYHIVVTTHTAQFETDVITFGPSTNISFFRMVMGLAFLSDDLIGVDSTMICHVHKSMSTGQKLQIEFPPFLGKSPFHQPLIFTSHIDQPKLAVTHDLACEGFDPNFSHIMVNGEVYKVICLLFRSQTLIGRATRTFLVEFPNGRRGVLKDSWSIDGRPTESAFLQGLEIPFGPSLIAACSLRTTSPFQNCIMHKSLPIIDECRVKRRVVTSPAGVHISNFSSLWELMVAFLDVVIGTMVP